jgi:predicted Zn finger-like uncharacterized protein
MIIQCKQCKTKFRFDDALMEGDGLWMRCSRCQHVFFQDNPAKTRAAAEPPLEPLTMKGQERVPRKEVRRPTFEPAVHQPTDAIQKEPASEAQDDDMKAFMKEVIGAEKLSSDEPMLDSKPMKQPGPDSVPLDFTRGVQFPPDLEASLEESVPAPPPKKSSGWKWALWAVLVIVVVPAIVYFFIFPDLGDRFTRIARKYMWGASQPAEGPFVIGQIKLQDVRQKIVANVVSGNIRVVEGTAVNQNDFPIARVRIKAELLDAYAVTQGERVSYAGNILTEEELVNLTEEDIQKKLSQPEGRHNMNERVPPNGRIPFMIVFSKEKPGVIKTTVVVAGAERLL